MFVDDIDVEEYRPSDTLTCWEFSEDEKVFYRVTWREDDNNLRAWRTTLDDTKWRPIRWLLPEDSKRPALPDYCPEIDKVISDFVREVTNR